MKRSVSLFFLFLYYIFAFFLYLLALPYVLFLLRRAKYRCSLPDRFFPLFNTRPKTDTIRFHTCSYGETSSMRSMASLFGDNIHFSVITDTGYDEAKKITTNVSFLPFEIFLPFWEPCSKVLVVAEAELWLMLFAVSKLKGSKTAIINARISDNSYKSYMRFRFFYSFLFLFVDLVMAQSEKDAERLREIGAKNVVVVGNTKVSNRPVATKIYKKDNNRLTVTAASTHFSEEELIFGAFLELLSQDTAKLIVVPRHPERFEMVASVLQNECEQKNLTFSRFSTTNTFDCDVTLVDCMGELINIYAISDIVVLGGSFVAIGGHNPIEPANFECKIISGQNIYNQKSTFEAVENYVLCDSDTLSETLVNHAIIKKSALDMKKDPLSNAKRHIDELLSTN